MRFEGVETLMHIYMLLIMHSPSVLSVKCALLLKEYVHQFYTERVCMNKGEHDEGKKIVLILAWRHGNSPGLEISC